MPELPDVELYIEALKRRVEGRLLKRVRITSPFLLRSVDVSPGECEGLRVMGIRRLGKRVVFELESQVFLVFHLMIAGRFQWADAGGPSRKGKTLATFDFETGQLTMTEAGSKKRASLHIVRGPEGLAIHDRGGVEPLEMTSAEFSDRLRSSSRTVKRALCDPTLFAGIGNAYSDEILHRAGMSPFKRGSNLDDSEIGRLFEAVKAVLQEWRDRLLLEHGESWPTRVTAFRTGMAVHGRFGEPCPDCGSPVQRVRFASNEMNYCPTCQTEGRLLADRGLSRILKEEWPRTLEDLEALTDSRRTGG